MAIIPVVVAGLIVFGLIAGIFALLWWLLGLVYALTIVFLVLCVFMILVVMFQKPKGGGLGGAFGGAGGGGGGSQAMFGTKTGDVLTWVTVIAFLVFLGLGMGLVYATRAQVGATDLGREVRPEVPPPPAAQPAPEAEDAPSSAIDQPTQEPSRALEGEIDVSGIGEPAPSSSPTTTAPDPDASRNAGSVQGKEGDPKASASGEQADPNAQ